MATTTLRLCRACTPAHYWNRATNKPSKGPKGDTYVPELSCPLGVPTPVKRDSRICFSIAYFASEADAHKYHDEVRRRGITYNGGWFHGMPCGRDKTWDHEDPVLGKLYAVTD